MESANASVNPGFLASGTANSPRHEADLIKHAVVFVEEGTSGITLAGVVKPRFKTRANHITEIREGARLVVSVIFVALALIVHGNVDLLKNISSTRRRRLTEHTPTSDGEHRSFGLVIGDARLEPKRLDGGEIAGCVQFNQTNIIKGPKFVVIFVIKISLDRMHLPAIVGFVLSVRPVRADHYISDRRLPGSAQRSAPSLDQSGRHHKSCLHMVCCSWAYEQAWLGTEIHEESRDSH